MDLVASHAGLLRLQRQRRGQQRLPTHEGEVIQPVRDPCCECCCATIFTCVFCWGTVFGPLLFFAFFAACLYGIMYLIIAIAQASQHGIEKFAVTVTL